MKQSWFASWLETIGSTSSGFVVSLGLQYAVCWWWDLPLRTHDNLLIIGMFTVASVLRGIAWRRLMERLHVRVKMSAGMLAVVAERQRQRDGEGYDDAHDDKHPAGELAAAAAAYLTTFQSQGMRAGPPIGWPWARSFWNPKDVRRNLVRGLALGLAELERFDRMCRRKDVQP
jgi:hypothetical protein